MLNRFTVDQLIGYERSVAEVETETPLSKGAQDVCKLFDSLGESDTLKKLLGKAVESNADTESNPGQ